MKHFLRLLALSGAVCLGCLLCLAGCDKNSPRTDVPAAAEEQLLRSQAPPAAAELPPPASIPA